MPLSNTGNQKVLNNNNSSYFLLSSNNESNEYFHTDDSLSNHAHGDYFGYLLPGISERNFIAGEPFASLIITYLVAIVVSVIFWFAFPAGTSLLEAFKSAIMQVIFWELPL